MPEVYLVMRRADIPQGVLQVVDLWPNTSSRNYIYTPGLGQTGYVRNIPFTAIDGDVTVVAPFTASVDLTGLSAYLIGNIDTTAAVGSAPFTGAEADAAAAGLIAIAQAGTVLDLAAVNGVLGGVVAGTTLSGGGSTGGLGTLLPTMAGRDWIIPAGSELSDGGGLFAGTVGNAEANITEYTQLYDIGQFKCSNLNGNVSLLKSANFMYDETAGAAVTVYADDGTLYV